MTVTVRSDMDKEWTFEEPAWMPLGYGLSADLFYMWSARRLIVFEINAAIEPQLIGADEDILCVFRLPDTWLFVCETSARLVTEARELSRVEMGDVIADAILDGSLLTLCSATGAETRVRITEDGLIA
jgi:hypothetical protein